MTRSTAPERVGNAGERPARLHFLTRRCAQKTPLCGISSLSAFETVSQIPGRLCRSQRRPLAPAQPVFVVCEGDATGVAAASPYAPGQGAAKVE
jgi:hypothetical protein